MTPEEQEKELRRLISDLMADLMVDVSLEKLSKYDGDIIEKGRLYLKSHNDRLDIIMQLITADRKRVALEARLDERQMLNFHRAYGKDYQATLEMLEESNDDRIAELKSQREEV